MNLKLSDEFISYLRDSFPEVQKRTHALKTAIFLEFYLDNEDFLHLNNEDFLENSEPLANIVLDHKIIQELENTGFLVKSDTLGYKRTIPIFKEQEQETQSADKFKWVSKFRDLFKQVNPDRWGTLSTCKERMKKFFSENPEVRVDEVMDATIMYLKNTDRRYIMKSHKFIYDGVGTSRNSTLEEWIEKLREVSSSTQSPKDITDKIQ